MANDGRACSLTVDPVFRLATRARYFPQWRFNPNHDAQGKFTSAPGGGSAKGAVKGPSGYRPGNWRGNGDRAAQVADQTAKFKKMLATYAPKTWTDAEREAKAREMAEMVVPAKPSIVYRNGDNQVVIGADTGMDQQKTDWLLSKVDEWQQRAPLSEDLHLIVSNYSTFPRNVLGETRLGTGDIRLSSRIFNPAPWSPGNGHVQGMMPVASTVSTAEYVIAHEWGHAVEPRSSRDQQKILIDFIGQSQSFYGRYTPHEAYAENWAEYQLTAGKTSSSAAQAYAKDFGWKP